MKKVAMIGVGKLGQDCAEVMAKHYDLVGYDIEPRVPDNFVMVPSIKDAVKDRDIIFVAAPTPHDPIYGGETPTSHLPNKDFDYSIVINILKEINNHTNPNQLVVLISTVLPGTVRSILRPCILNARFVYNPYLIAMGTVKWDMVNPEMVIIGTEDGTLTGDAQELIDFYKPMMENDPRYEIGTWDEAESIKIFYNTFISTKLALVNMIQDVAETNGNINVDVVTNALAKSTHRIMGPAYMKAGLGDAGACHPRDNIALRYLAERLDLGYDLFDSIMKAREVQAERMAKKCLELGNHVTIIGKAYKPKVSYINGSASMLVGHYIEQHGGKVNYYDEHTGDFDLKPEWTDVYLIGYWDDYVEKLILPQNATLIDPWRKAEPKHHSGSIIHYGDTRPKKKFECPVENKNLLKIQIYDIWPELHDYDKDIHYVYAGVHSDFNFNFRSVSDIIHEIKNALQNGKSKIIFTCEAEDFQEQIIIKIHKILRKLEDVIDPNNVFYLSGADNIQTVYEKICTKHNFNIRINLLSARFFEYAVRIKSEQFRYTGEYEVRSKGKKFLCFNKVPRKHRLMLLDKVLENDLLPQSYYSFQGYDDVPEWQNHLDPKYKHVQKYKDKLPIVLNITEDRPNPVLLEPQDFHYFNDSHFSVVTETVFFNNDEKDPSIFFSEKVWKPIIMMHPFILMGRSGSLKKLKDLGYKTFAPYIDERYDDITDDQERFEFIIREIQRLCSLDPYQLKTWQENIKPIVEFNKVQYYDNTDFRNTKNIKELFEDRKTKSIIDEFTTVKVPNTNVLITPADELEKLYQYQINNSIVGDVELDSKLKIHFARMLDGGGLTFKKQLIEIIQSNKVKKLRFEKTLEWCCGYGVLGFELLGLNETEKLVVTDYFPRAVETCLTNAANNKLTSRVKGYVTPTISGIPETEKFDLVIGNPPHIAKLEEFKDTSKKDNVDNDIFLNNARLCLDHNWTIHGDFFKHIMKHLLPHAEIYLIENNDHHVLKHMAAVAGLLHLESIPIESQAGMFHGTIMRFKYLPAKR